MGKVMEHEELWDTIYSLQRELRDITCNLRREVDGLHSEVDDLRNTVVGLMLTALAEDNPDML